MTWSKALTFSHDGTAGNYFTNVVAPYFNWMGTQPGVDTVVSAGSLQAGIKYTSTRFGNTYGHGLVFYFITGGNGTMAVHHWDESNRNTNTLSTAGTRKRNDPYFSPMSNVGEYEVWQSDEHKSWMLFHKAINSSFMSVYGMFLDPDDLCQGAEIPEGNGYREMACISDTQTPLGVYTDTSNTFINTGVPMSYADQKSPTVLVRNYYAIFASIYDLNLGSAWPYTVKADYGMTYMGTHNDMHCSASTSNSLSIQQLDGDSNYYIATGGGGGLFLDCGATEPNLFS